MLKRLKQLIVPKLRQLRRNWLDSSKRSWSQCGEDLILSYLLNMLGISKVTYLDVGAHHPSYLSNTYLFYRRGGHGVCVEPDPVLHAEFREKRPRDISLNCGLGAEPGKAEFFIMSTPTLNTFSGVEAERYQSYGKEHVVKTIQIEIRTINDILERHFEQCPDLVSIDVEGFDYQILQSLDFGKYRPRVFCLETLSYTEDKSERKLTEIIELMERNGYMAYADTYINTIFIDRSVWQSRP